MFAMAFEQLLSFKNAQQLPCKNLEGAGDCQIFVWSEKISESGLTGLPWETGILF
jgi:hypothetical protein